jgi:hypothetical protein
MRRPWAPCRGRSEFDGLVEVKLRRGGSEFYSTAAGNTRLRRVLPSARPAPATDPAATHGCAVCGLALRRPTPTTPL